MGAQQIPSAELQAPPRAGDEQHTHFREDALSRSQFGVVGCLCPEMFPFLNGNTRSLEAAMDAHVGLQPQPAV